MDMTNRVSAGELRQLGLNVPDGVPDCATVRRSAIRMKVSDTQCSPSTISFGVDVEILDAFEWVEITFVASKNT